MSRKIKDMNLKMKQTRGVFAIISPSPTTILLSEYRDRKHWNLPGGGVRENESDHEALYREVLDETGLEVVVKERIGMPLKKDEDEAILFKCEIIGGALLSTEESHHHAFANFHDAQNLPIVSSRMNRMVRDGYSLLQKPVFSGSIDIVPEAMKWVVNKEASRDFQCNESFLFIKQDSSTVCIWDRIKI